MYEDEIGERGNASRPALLHIVSGDVGSGVCSRHGVKMCLNKVKSLSQKELSENM